MTRPMTPPMTQPLTQPVTRANLATRGRGAWLPTWPLIGARLLELRKRRLLITVTVVFTIALPVLFYGI